jgi:hypothetical protein
LGKLRQFLGILRHRQSLGFGIARNGHSGHITDKCEALTHESIAQNMNLNKKRHEVTVMPGWQLKQTCNTRKFDAQVKKISSVSQIKAHNGIKKEWKQFEITEKSRAYRAGRNHFINHNEHLTWW